MLQFHFSIFILFWCISEFIVIPGRANQRGHWGLKTLLKCGHSYSGIPAPEDRAAHSKFFLRSEGQCSSVSHSAAVILELTIQDKWDKIPAFTGLWRHDHLEQSQKRISFQERFIFQKESGGWGKAVWRVVTLLKSFFWSNAVVVKAQIWYLKKCKARCMRISAFTVLLPQIAAIAFSNWRCMLAIENPYVTF